MTFSILARCTRTGALGVAITSSSPAVASRCAFARAGVGAAATQNVTDPRLGPQLLDALSRGQTAEQALAAARAGAPHIEHRQLGVVDAAGQVASFSGSHTLGIHGSRHGAGVLAAGNLLASEAVLDAAVAAFDPDGDQLLEVRLLAALSAGLAAGGELGPLHSAGLVVCETAAWPVTDLRVDWSQTPVTDLGVLWDLWAPQKADYLIRALDPTGAPGYGVPGDDR